MPNSKKKKKTVLETWTTLKTQLLKTLTELKANHKDNWKVIKHKSAAKQVDLPTVQLLEDVNYCLRELAQMDDRPPNQMLSPTDQAKYDSLKARLKELKTESNDAGWRKVLENLDNLISTQQAAKRYYEESIMVDWNCRELNRKLNWLRTLVRAGDIQQLQELVRQAKI